MTIILDNGHGKETPGKRSVDGQLMEWEYTRDITARVRRTLERKGVKVSLLVPEEEDVPLKERVTRANETARRDSEKSAILVSIHCDADGMGNQWTIAHGWSARVAPNASAKSRTLAATIARHASANGLRVRRPKPTQDYWEQNLYICKFTKMPAVLTENLFMTNEADKEFLMSEQGRQTIAKLHVDAILEYISAQKKA